MEKQKEQLEKDLNDITNLHNDLINKHEKLLEEKEQLNQEKDKLIEEKDNLQKDNLTLNEQYGYINYESKKILNGIQYIITIDFEKTNIKTMSKDGYLDSNYIINNHLNLTGLIKKYESKGAHCK